MCPTSSDAQRVPSWDGVPLDADVTLPATGEGPFPVIAMLHGFPGTKAGFEGPSTDARLVRRNSVFYARRGYAVLTYSARGFGRSCGEPSSRTAGCERGWTHLFDQRYEARDTQQLLGLLVDEGVARPQALGVTGESGGSIQSLELAFLRNRVRLPDGRFTPWRSPAGRRLSLTAAFPTWAGDDIAAALAPNGRFLDFARGTAGDTGPPVGVSKAAFLSALFLVADSAGFIAPERADPSADLRTWKAVVERGEPYGSSARRIVRELEDFHGSARLTGTPAPLLVQDGWTDDLFPATEALRVYNRLRDRNLRAKVALQLLDTGHARGGAHRNQEDAANDQALRFFDAWLKRRGTPPAPGAVLAYTQACPRGASGGTRLTAASWTRLHPGAVRLRATAVQTVASDGGSLDVARAFTPNFGTIDACATVPAQRSPGTAVISRATRTAFTLAGRPTIDLVLGAQPATAQLDGRLWDVDPGRGTQLLVTRGAYRVTAGQHGRIQLQLNGNAYRFAAGHEVMLELTGRDPDSLRAGNQPFTLRVRDVTVELPVRERANRARRIVAPRFAMDPAAPSAGGD